MKFRVAVRESALSTKATAIDKSYEFVDLHDVPQSYLFSEPMPSKWLVRADCRLLPCHGGVFTFPGDVVDGVLQDMELVVSATTKTSVQNHKRKRQKK